MVLLLWAALLLLKGVCEYWSAGVGKGGATRVEGDPDAPETYADMPHPEEDWFTLLRSDVRGISDWGSGDLRDTL